MQLVYSAWSDWRLTFGVLQWEMIWEKWGKIGTEYWWARLLINKQESLWLRQPLSHQFCQLGQTGGSRPVVRRPHCQLREGRGQGWGGDWEVAGGWRPGGALQWERWGVRTGRTWVIDEEMFVLDRALIRRVFIPATTTRLDLLGLSLLSLQMMISHEISYLHLMY